MEGEAPPEPIQVNAETVKRGATTSFFVIFVNFCKSNYGV